MLIIFKSNYRAWSAQFFMVFTPALPAPISVMINGFLTFILYNGLLLIGRHQRTLGKIINGTSYHDYVPYFLFPNHSPKIRYSVMKWCLCRNISLWPLYAVNKIRINVRGVVLAVLLFEDNSRFVQGRHISISVFCGIDWAISEREWLIAGCS